MHTPRISIILPTVGCTTLRRAVTSALAAMGPIDELIVVGDGPQPTARGIMAEITDTRVRYMETVTTHKWGCYQYDIGSMMATGEFLMFLRMTTF
jgi:hypothetical protein